ncbi:hypothetical protein F4810DRAFT_10492 [Camillea tinctor]|nr:hypothetical protein F4810DRAFT_10492 [Camillea tinctor]
MASFVAKHVLKKIFKEQAGSSNRAEDVYFEYVPATRLDGTRKAGKLKKVRKALPPGLSEHDAHILTKVKKRAYQLDMSFGSFMGINFGWGSIIGLFPIAGDVVDALLAWSVVHTAKQVEGGLPRSVRYKMYAMVVLDFICGLIPGIGDVFDAIIIANTRNAERLENYLREKGRKNLQASGLPVPDIDPSDPAEFDRLNSDPPASYTHREKRSRRRSRPADEEMGIPRPTPARTRRH